MTAASHWQETPNPRILKTWRQWRHLTLPTAYTKKQNMSSMSQKTVPTTRQTMTRPFCSNLIKALLNQHLLCQVTHPPLKASVSSITDYSHRGSGNYTQSYRTLCFCQTKTSPGASLQGRTILPTLNIWTQTFTLPEMFIPHYKKGNSGFFDIT